MSDFGIVWVSGRSLVPMPAAGIITFIQPSIGNGPEKSTHRGRHEENLRGTTDERIYKADLPGCHVFHFWFLLDTTWIQFKLSLRKTMERTPGGNWYAIYTRCHHERKVAKILSFDAFEVFFPTRRVLSARKDRRKLLEVPLLRNYLFVNTSKDRFTRINNTPGVAYVLGYNGVPTPVPDVEVDSLKILVHSGRQVMPHAYLREGDTVFIKEGPFRGVVGVLLKTDLQTWRLVVSVHLMNRSVVVTVPMEYVEKSL